MTHFNKRENFRDIFQRFPRLSVIESRNNFLKVFFFLRSILGIHQASQLSPLPTPQSFFYAKSDFFWRRPLRVTARLDVSTVALTSQPSPLPTRQKKKYAKKNRGAIFFWRHPLRVTARLDESTVIFFVIVFVKICR